MKRSWILSGLLSIALAASAFANPSYDSRAWESFMDGKATAVPAGVPIGKGAVGLWHGDGFWSNNRLVDISNAIDASKLDGVVISDESRTGKRYYTGDTGSTFLNAVVAEMRKLTKDKKAGIPVAYLSYAPSAVPMQMMDLPGQSVTLGLFVKDKTGAKLLANGSYRNGRVISVLNLPLHQKHEQYVSATASKKQEYLAMDDKTLRKTLNEAGRTSNTAGTIATKNAKDLFELEDQVEAELGAELDGLSPEERKARIREEVMQRQAADVADKQKDRTKYELDVEKTWLMLEAVVMQQNAVVTHINISNELRAVLISYAAAQKRPQAAIDRVFALSNDSKSMRGNITVRLGCSLRDRFLGCSERDDATDALVNARAATMLKGAETLSGESQMEVLRMIEMSGADGIYAELDAFSQKLGPKTKQDKELRSQINKIRMKQRINAADVAVICQANSATSGGKKRAGNLGGLNLPMYQQDEAELNKLPGALAAADDNCRQKFVRLANNVNMLRYTDDPKVAPYILLHFKNLAPAHNSKEFQIKRLNVAMGDLLVYEMPQDKKTLADAIAYWETVVGETAGKSKNDLIVAALTRANLKLPDAKAESVANIDFISAQMPTLVQNYPVLAVNLHRLAEHTLHSSIPQSRQTSRNYSGQFEKWWAANKPLFVPKQLVHNEDYERYKSFYRPRGMVSMDGDAGDGDVDNTNSALIKPAAVPANSAVVPAKPPAAPAKPPAAPAKPKAKKPHNQKSGKTIDNTAAVLLKNAK